MDYDIARANMVDSQVKVNDVTDLRIISAMQSVKREYLVASEQKELAYAEFSPQIAPSRYLMKPRECAKLIQALDIQDNQNILCIAAPYAACVLRLMGAKVTASEADTRTIFIIEPYLKSLGIDMVCQPFDEVKSGPYDAIICENSLSDVPQAWINALTDFGKIAYISQQGASGKASIATRLGESVSRKIYFDGQAPVLPLNIKNSEFVF